MIFADKIVLKKFSVLMAALMLLTAQTTHASSGGVVIFQVQSGASSGASQEYISVYNNSSEPVDVSNWCVVYSSASDATQTELKCLKPATSSKLLLPAYNYLTLATNEFVIAHPDWAPDFIFSAGISSSGGHIKVLDKGKSIVDKVAWGSASSPEGYAMQAPPTSKILQRLNDSGNDLKDSNNNSADFIHADLGLMQGKTLYEEYSEPEPAGPSPILSELMPDAAGADAGKEFIEFHNPHSTHINLKDFRVLLGPSFSKNYSLPDITLQPGSYVALTDLQTGITLPNTSASLKLIAANDEIVSSTESYEQPGENISWALINGEWKITYSPTPGQENILLEAELCSPGECVGAGEDAKTPCKPDQVRSAETGRCRKISSLIAALTACKTGYIRNIGTGRCRAAEKVKVPAPCKPEQVRNPETNRCKNAGTAKGKAPCPSGQERNDKTGRCRKASGSSKMNNVKDVQTGLLANSAKWWAAGLAATGSASYALYEWRREAWLIVEVVKSRILPG